MFNRTKNSKRLIDEMDHWLDNQGYYRKHAPRDASCLFRAVSEQVFLKQALHSDVRRQVSEYIYSHGDEFQKEVSMPIDLYADKIRNQNEWGGFTEIKAMSKLYKVDFELFQEVGKPKESITDNGFEKKIILCLSLDRHFDAVYTKEYIERAAFCQSIVYEMLYKDVFNLKEVDFAVDKMLNDKSNRFQRYHVPSFSEELELRDTSSNMKDLIQHGIVPFPYKVAKALHPDIYRNVEYDTWNDYRKGLRYGYCAWTSTELQVGVKCKVNMDEKAITGYIQQMTPNKGPVIIFSEECGKMITVPYDTLEILPPPPPFSFHTSQLSTRSLASKLFQLQCQQKSEQKLRIQEADHKINEEENNHVVTSATDPHTEDDSKCDIDSNGFQNLEQGLETVNQKPESLPVHDNYSTAYHNMNPQPQPHTSDYQPQPFLVNLGAQKSVNIDGSDLPYSDVSTLRFFYNLGLDHVEGHCPLWNIQSGNTYCNQSLVNSGYFVDNPIPVVTPITPTNEQSFNYEPYIPVQDVRPGQVFIYPQVMTLEQYNGRTQAQDTEITPRQTIPDVDYNYDYEQHNYVTSTVITPDGLIYQTIIPHMPPNQPNMQ